MCVYCTVGKKFDIELLQCIQRILSSTPYSSENFRFAPRTFTVPQVKLAFHTVIHANTPIQFALYYGVASHNHLPHRNLLNLKTSATNKLFQQRVRWHMLTSNSHKIIQELQQAFCFNVFFTVFFNSKQNRFCILLQNC